MSYTGKNTALRLNTDHYGEVIVDRNDIVYRHQEEKYDHIRVLAGEDIGSLAMSLCFFQRESLDAIAEHGIPEAYLDEPTELTVMSYEADQIMKMECQFEE